MKKSQGVSDMWGKARERSIFLKIWWEKVKGEKWEGGECPWVPRGGLIHILKGVGKGATMLKF